MQVGFDRRGPERILAGVALAGRKLGTAATSATVEKSFYGKDRRSKIGSGFFYSAPEANSVQLVGDFTHWQSKPVNLVKQADGVWKTSIALAAGTYHYRFLVDGTWCDDPQCTLRIPNIFGSHNMVREVSSSAEILAESKSSEKKPGRRRVSKSA
jgi:1,4-alpha-glucan branching enzyme